MKPTVMLIVLAGLVAMSGCGNTAPPPPSTGNVQEAPAPDKESKESENLKPAETLDDALLGSVLSESTVVPDINGGAIIVTIYGVWHVDRTLGAKRLREAMPSNSTGALPKKTLGKVELFGLWQADAVRFRRAEQKNRRLQEEIDELQGKLEDAEREKEPIPFEDVSVMRPSKSNKSVLAKNR